MENLNISSAVEKGGIYVVTHRNALGEVVSVDEIHNLVPTEGLRYMNKVLFEKLAASDFYMGLYANNYSPQATDTMATLNSVASEVTAYNEVSRPIYNGVVADGNVSNTASKALFTANGTVTARGAFLSTSSVKGGTAGSLGSLALFSNPKSLTTGDTLTVEYIFASTSST